MYMSIWVSIYVRISSLYVEFFIYILFYFLCATRADVKKPHESPKTYICPLAFRPPPTNKRSRHDMNSVCIVSFRYGPSRDDGNFWFIYRLAVAENCQKCENSYAEFRPSLFKVFAVFSSAKCPIGRKAIAIVVTRPRVWSSGLWGNFSYFCNDFSTMVTVSTTFSMSTFRNKWKIL